MCFIYTKGLAVYFIYLQSTSLALIKLLILKKDFPEDCRGQAVNTVSQNAAASGMKNLTLR